MLESSRLNAQSGLRPEPLGNKEGNEPVSTLGANCHDDMTNNTRTSGGNNHDLTESLKQTNNGRYNLEQNMGQESVRPHRQNQDNLMCVTARITDLESMSEHHVGSAVKD